MLVLIYHRRSRRLPRGRERKVLASIFSKAEGGKNWEVLAEQQMCNFYFKNIFIYFWFEKSNSTEYRLLLLHFLRVEATDPFSIT